MTDETDAVVAITRETKASVDFGIFQITFTFGIPN